MFRLHESPSDKQYPFKIKRKKWILEWCNKQGGLGIEFGCGHSRVSDDILATDKIPRDFVTNKVEGFISEADMIVDAESLPFETDTFNFIIASHLIEHFAYPEAIMEWWIATLKKGGILILITPDAELWEHSPDHAKEFTKYELKELLDIPGVEILELDNAEWEKTEIKCVVKKK